MPTIVCVVAVHALGAAVLVGAEPAMQDRRVQERLVRGVAVLAEEAITAPTPARSHGAVHAPVGVHAYYRPSFCDRARSEQGLRFTRSLQRHTPSAAAHTLFRAAGAHASYSAGGLHAHYRGTHSRQGWRFTSSLHWHMLTSELQRHTLTTELQRHTLTAELQGQTLTTELQGHTLTRAAGAHAHYRAAGAKAHH